MNLITVCTEYKSKAQQLSAAMISEAILVFSVLVLQSCDIVQDWLCCPFSAREFIQPQLQIYYIYAFHVLYSLTNVNTL